MYPLISKMDNNENDNIKLSCSTFYITGSGIKLDAYRAFDNSTDLGWNFEGDGFPQYIKIMFKNNIPIIKKISICNGSGSSVCVNKFTFQGSNDDIIYDTLYTGNHPYGDTNTTKKEYDINTIKRYKYYKINVLSSYYTLYSGYGGIGELQLFGEFINYLIKQQDKYYSIKEDYYNKDVDEYNSPQIITPTISNFESYGINDLSSIHSNALNKLIDNKYNIAMLK